MILGSSNEAAISKVSSVEPSSITSNSQFLTVWLRMEQMACATVVAQLKTGMPKETIGGSWEGVCIEFGL
jgi:hypothetical protein